jgi:hypothetical protein
MKIDKDGDDSSSNWNLGRKDRLPRNLKIYEGKNIQLIDLDKKENESLSGSEDKKSEQIDYEKGVSFNAVFLLHAGNQQLLQFVKLYF